MMTAITVGGAAKRTANAISVAPAPRAAVAPSTWTIASAMVSARLYCHRRNRGLPSLSSQRLYVGLRITVNSSVRSGREEGGKLGDRLIRILLWKEMTAGNRPAGDGVRPLPPDAERAAYRFIPAIEAAALAPQRQRRTGDAAASSLIGPVHRIVDGDGSPVFLAHGVHCRGIAEGCDIGSPQ